MWIFVSRMWVSSSMITDIYIVNSKPIDLTDFNLNFHFINTSTLKGQKEGIKLKSHWAAKLEPFAIVTEDKKVVKAFYSEAEDVIKSLTKYLTEHESTSNQSK